MCIRDRVGTPEQLKAWARMDANTVQSVIGSNFQRSYQEWAKQEAEFQALPGDIKQMIGGPVSYTHLDVYKRQACSRTGSWGSPG